jgi:hypothetical protein
MKTPKLIFALALITCSAASAQSDEKHPVLPKAVFKISPLHFFNSTFQFGTELFNDARSRSANIDVGIRSGSQSYDDVKGFSTEIGYRKYVKPMTLRTRKSGRQFHQGIYYNFFVSGSYFSGYNDSYQYYTPSAAPTYDNRKVTFKSFGAGFYMGLQKTLWEVVLMDIYVGGGIKMTEANRSADYNDYYYDEDLFDPGFEGIYPKIGIKFGIGL